MDIEMTDEEMTAIEAERRARKQWEKAGFDEHSDRLRRIGNRWAIPESGES